jgi:hypothetical protein
VRARHARSIDANFHYFTLTLTALHCAVPVRKACSLGHDIGDQIGGLPIISWPALHSFSNCCYVMKRPSLHMDGLFIPTNNTNFQMTPGSS